MHSTKRPSPSWHHCPYRSVGYLHGYYEYNTSIPLVLVPRLTVPVISIPIIFLWKARMSVKQKFCLGAFLTVNVWLIIIALVRVIFYKRGNVFDVTWSLFFRFFEANVAILAACFSAFRSLFVISTLKRRAQNHRPNYLLHQRIFRKTPPDHQPLDDLPSIPIPGVTLHGIRTMIWQNNGTQVTKIGSNDSRSNTAVEKDREDTALEQGLNDTRNKIAVTHELSIESNRVSKRLSSCFNISVF